MPIFTKGIIANQESYFELGGWYELVDLREQYENIDSYPLMESDDEIMENSAYKPVFIVLISSNYFDSKVIKMWTRSKWTHALLSMWPSLSKMYAYTWGDGNDGFTTERLETYQDHVPKDVMSVNAVLIRKDQWNTVRKNLNWYVSHKGETKYSFANLIRIAFNKIQKTGGNMKMVCSQFVYTILQISNIDVGLQKEKPNNLVTPKDLSLSEKIYNIYEGPNGQYNVARAKRVLAKVISEMEADNKVQEKPEEDK